LESGHDTFIFSRDFDDYEFSISGGVITIEDLTGNDGIDRLHSFEDLIFTNGRAEYEAGELIFIPNDGLDLG